MNHADTPMPGEDPGALIEDPTRLDEVVPASEEDIEADPQPQPTVPVEDDPAVKDTEVQPT
ncbi:hypothetical protein FV226_12395 [Methylobacterium sp. WL12]|uniref:hypothetical protein n=1 Tax=Methylobacterium sp. WL12 TaxID=2603890 RepID=UPI0011CCAC96|nr:hypothetical protein [Methylobacterium sp. WL12]TXM72330.1 hypothetical protein FV226_12395 [Methylobacterium sp. WL12]